MASIELKRMEMAILLNALRNEDYVKVENLLTPMLGAYTHSIPAYFLKLLQHKTSLIGFSLNEIVLIGSHIQQSNISLTAMQNWVKRDVKDLIIAPKKGKKYSFDQTALLYLVDDLKHALDFHSIRSLLSMILNDPEDRTDDLINPIDFYMHYTSLFDELITNQKTAIGENYLLEAEKRIVARAHDITISYYSALPAEQQHAIEHIIVIATFAVYSHYFQSLAKNKTIDLLKSYT